MPKSNNNSSLFNKKRTYSLLLVALGDSTPTGYGLSSKQDFYVHVYANYIEQDLNTVVKVHNWATNNLRTVSEWVKEVQTNEKFRKDFLHANIITLWLGWHNVIPTLIKDRNTSGLILIKEPDLQQLHTVTSPMQGAFDDLVAEISSLSSPTDTLILIADIGIPSLFVSKWKAFGTFNSWYQHAYKVWREFIIQAAKKYNIHVVPTHEVINGKNGDQVLPAKYMQSDGIHFNEDGHKLIANAYRKIGYQLSEQ
ncbi:MAG: SGNH/GDSL hydrolase family protein [Asgard group archaeon]|nr:SGNH/GDSL hydrolase family protein [Asgard group archaeon]